LNSCLLGRHSITWTTPPASISTSYSLSWELKFRDFKIFIFSFFFLGKTGVWTQGLVLLGRCSATLSHTFSPFAFSFKGREKWGWWLPMTLQARRDLMHKVRARGMFSANHAWQLVFCNLKQCSLDYSL
jgi:hypothetical protein